ncbi:MAG: ABC transporter ATP-binding protein, partial [Pygmaiobacter sp.]
MTKLYALLPQLSKMQPLIANSVNASLTTADSATAAVGTLFARAFCSELGADTAAIQNLYILSAGGRMLLIAFLGAIASICVGLFASRIGAGAARDLRRDLFSRVSRFSNSELDRFSTASLITRTTNDVTQVQQTITMGLRMVCYAPIMGIGGIVMALSKSPEMSWILALAVGLIIVLIAIVYHIAMPKFSIMQKLIDRLNLVTRENLSGMMVVRAFGTQKFEEKRFDAANRDLNKTNLFVNRIMVFLMPAMNLVMNGITLLIIWVGGKEIAASTLQVGDMMAFMQYAMQIMFSFLMISMMFIMLPRAAVSGVRINEVLSTDLSIQDPKAPKSLGKRADGRVEFHDVSFKYGEADENVLEHISFTARPGETTAFIGSTGSGKSTLINLIPRFYDVTEGSITIDGVDIRSLSLSELRRTIGYVPHKG